MGYIYVIGMDESPLVKIGQTKNLASRLRNLQAGNPFRLIVRKSYCCDDFMAVERVMHAILRAQHSIGEWFTLDGIDVDAVFEQACIIVAHHPLLQTPCLPARARSAATDFGGEKLCCRCLQVFPATFEFFEKSAHGTPKSYCRPCDAMILRESKARRKARNPEAWLAKYREYGKAARARRAAKLSASSA